MSRGDTSRGKALAHNARGCGAFAAGDLYEALDAWECAVAALGPADDDIAREIYENLGLARMNLGRPRAAARAFLRALDGELEREGREQSARYLADSLAQSGLCPAAPVCARGADLEEAVAF